MLTFFVEILFRNAQNISFRFEKKKPKSISYVRIVLTVSDDRILPLRSLVVTSGTTMFNIRKLFLLPV